MEVLTTLYTQTEVLSGYVDVPHTGRLLDLLNNVSVEGDWSDNWFLTVSHVNICDADGNKERAATTYVNKVTIHMALLADGNLARGIGANVGSKSFPFVPKSPVPVKLHIPYHTLIGYIYCASGQQVQHVLGEKPMFLPLTDVSVQPVRNGVEFMAPFVAVNKDQLLSLRQEEFIIDWSRLFKAFRKLIELKVRID